MSSTSDVLPEPLASLLDEVPRLDGSLGAILIGAYVSLVYVLPPSTLDSG